MWECVVVGCEVACGVEWEIDMHSARGMSVVCSD